MDIMKLESKISRNSANRKKEIAIITENVSKNSEKYELVRAAFLLLYAHFEGFTKESIRLYLEYLNNQNIRTGDVILHLRTLHNSGKIVDIKSSNYKTTYHELTKSLYNDDQIFHVNFMDKSIIDTESNLKFKVIREMLFTLGMEPRDFIMKLDTNNTNLNLRENFINSNIVDKRNKIAHGEMIRIKDSEFYEVKEFVLEYMDQLSNYILEFCNQKKFMKNYL